MSATTTGHQEVNLTETGTHVHIVRRVLRTIRQRDTGAHRAYAAVLTLVTFAALLGMWEWYVQAKDVSPAVMAPPSEVWDALWTGFADGTLQHHWWVTFQEIFLGFVLGSSVGILIAVVVSESYWFRRLLYPYIIASQSIPKIALAPLFLIWFGFGISSKVILGISITFFPVLINTVSGLKSADPAQVELLRAYTGSPWQIFLRVRLPTSLPYVFAGLELAVVLSVISAVVAEFVGSFAGLGHLVMVHNTSLDIASLFAVLIVLSATGFVLHWIVQKIGKRVVFWQKEAKNEFGF